MLVLGERECHSRRSKMKQSPGFAVISTVPLGSGLCTVVSAGRASVLLRWLPGMTLVAPRPVRDMSESTYAILSENIGRAWSSPSVSGSEFCRYPS